MAVTRWTIFNPATAVTTTFEANPSAGGSPRYTRSIQATPTLAPDGAAIISEGQRPLPTGQITGTILSATQYEQFRTWFNLANPVDLTDDLGRTYSILITGFAPDRQYSATRFWRHAYTVDYLILAEN